VKDATDGVNDLAEFQDNNASFLSNEDRAMGAILGNLFGGKMGSLGIFINENAAPFSQALGAQYYDRNLNEAWNVVWGYKFSQLAVGLKFDRSYSSLETTFQDSLGFIFKPIETLTGAGVSLPLTGDNARQLFNQYALLFGSGPFNTIGFGGGVTWNFEMNGKPSFLDLSGELRRYTLEVTNKNADPLGDTKDNGSMSFAFNARAHLQTSDDFEVVPVFNFYSIDQSLKQTVLVGTAVEDTSAKIKSTGINLGLAGQWKLRESDWLTMGVAYQHVKLDAVDTPNDVLVKYTTAPNLFGALESNVFSWLTLRLGASKPIFSKLELEDDAASLVELSGIGFPADTKVEIKDSPFQYSVGLGFHLGHIDVDALMNQDFVFTGGALAGNDNSEIPFTRLSATYRW
jgi:hypothetical protein